MFEIQTMHIVNLCSVDEKYLLKEIIRDYYSVLPLFVPCFCHVLSDMLFTEKFQKRYN